MQELEKILEEIKSALKEIYLDIANNYDISDLSFDDSKVACVASKFRCTADDKVEKIIHKHIFSKDTDITNKCGDCSRRKWYQKGYDDGKKNDGWIPVEERLPEEWEKVIVWYEYFRYGDYNRMHETYGIGWQYGGHWAGDVSGTKARCIAWKPLPEPYRLKQPETCKHTGGSCCWPIDQCSDCPNNPERSENDQ